MMFIVDMSIPGPSPILGLHASLPKWLTEYERHPAHDIPVSREHQQLLAHPLSVTIQLRQGPSAVASWDAQMPLVGRLDLPIGCATPAPATPQISR
jgi:hypothetical protein